MNALLWRPVAALAVLALPFGSISPALAEEPVPAEAAGGTETTLDVLKVVDGEYIVETVTVPTRDAAATEDRIEDGVGVVDASPSVTYQVVGSPDPYWDEQDPVAASKARTAWQRTQGEGQIVAVLDTGINPTHEDLVGALVPGKNIATGPGNPWHGTGVAGVVAMRYNNGRGGAGVAPQSKVMPIRVCDDNGCTSANVARGILWAADHGADVINMSLGGAGYSDVTAAAIRYALDKNIIVVASSGNDGLNGNPVMYPAANSGVIAVSSTQANGTPSTWAVNGWQVDISTIGDSVLIPMEGNSYGNGSGTSFSGPAVAGAAALLRSSHPGITPEEIQAALQASADSSSWDRRWGAGRLDIPAAMAAADRTTPITATGAPGAVDVSWSAVEGASEYTIRVDGIVRATVTGTTARIDGLTDGNQVAVDVQPSGGERSKPALVTVGAPAPSAPTLHSASLRGTSTSAIVDLSASITGTPGARYAILRDGVSIGTVTYTFTSTPKTLSIGIGAMPTYETRWQLRSLDNFARASAPSNTAVAGSGIPPLPDALTGLAARVDGGKLYLTWDDLNSTYSYQVSVDGNVVATSKTPGAVVPAPPADTRRTYQVAAVDPYGQAGPAGSTDVGPPPNTLPVAADDALTVPYGGGAQTLFPLTNDSDADGDTLSVVSVGPASKGTAALVDARTLRYTPSGVFEDGGTDTFTYTVSDGRDTATGTVAVTFEAAPPNTAPVTSDDTVTIPYGGGVRDIFVLANDSDAEGDTLSVVSAAGASKGSTAVVGGRLVRYTPSGVFEDGGTDTFTYTVSDGRASSTGTVAVTFVAAPPNTAPVTVDDTVTIPYGGGAQDLSPLTNDRDEEGAPLSLVSVEGASKGTASLLDPETIRYSPSGTFEDGGTDTFTYTVTDGRLTATGAVAVTFEAATRIDLHHTSLGGSLGVLGAATGPEMDLDGGRVRSFENGRIFAQDGADPVATVGALSAAHWVSFDRLGFPTVAQFTAARGGIGQHFEKGSLYASGRGTFTIPAGAIRDRWVASGAENGLGYPTSQQFGTARGGAGQHFEYGSVYSSARGTFAISRSIRDRWIGHGQVRALGFPTSHQFASARGGAGQHFERGTIFSTSKGTYLVRGAVRDRWAALGWERGRLGNPTSGQYRIRSGIAQNFQGGKVSVTKDRRGRTVVTVSHHRFQR